MQDQQKHKLKLLAQNIDILRKLDKPRYGSELAKKLNKTPQRISERIKVLVSEGLVELREIKAGEQGGRIKYYGLTKYAKRFLDDSSSLNIEERIKTAVETLKLINNRNPTIKEIAIEVREDPADKEFSKLLFRIAKEIDWRPPTRDDLSPKTPTPPSEPDYYLKTFLYPNKKI